MRFPTLEEYALAKSAATRTHRIILPFHRKMYRAITAWAAGKLPDGKRNLGIFIPPRHTKTTTAREAVEWLTGMIPDSQWIYTSYSGDLAQAQTVQIRDTISEPWYQRMFPHTRIKSGNARQDDIATTAGGKIYAAGMNGTITGYGAGQKRDEFGGAIVIDDPLSANEARSPTKRAHANEWYTQTLKSRRNHDKTPILLIMQRLHIEDLAGHIQKTEPDEWHFLTLPAMDEITGEMLWTETFSRESAEKLKEIDPATFYAQYQQQPIIPGGSMIKTDWWQWFDLDDNYRFNGLLFATADTAYKAKSSADASVIRIWHGTRQHLDCIDCVYGRWEFPELLAQAKAIYSKWHDKGLNNFLIEDKASGTPLVQTLLSQGIHAIPWVPKDFDFPDDKVSRVQEASWTIAGGKVRLPVGKNHSQILVNESAQFMPDMSHAHDDHVDTLTMAVSVWRVAGGGKT